MEELSKRRTGTVRQKKKIKTMEELTEDNKRWSQTKEMNGEAALLDVQTYTESTKY